MRTIRSRGGLRLAAASWLIGATAAEAAGEPMHGPRWAVAEPIAVRGGVLMVPLVADRPGNGWPRTLELTGQDGRELSGLVAWVHPSLPEGNARWTQDPRGLAVRRIEPGDDTSVPGTGRPYLLVSLPRDGDGAMTFRGQRMQPRWLDRVNTAPRDMEVLELTDSLTRPDPRSAFEHWRWVQLAGRMEMTPPAVEAYGKVPSLVARHYSDLWRFGLVRLGRADAEALHRCLNLLVRICYDGPRAFATWVIDPAEIGSLLKILLDADRSDREIVEAVDLWVDRQGPLIVRIAPRDPEQVVVGIANRSRLVIDARAQWLGSGEVAAAVTLPPGVLRRVTMPRPVVGAGSGSVDLAHAARTVQVLLIEVEGLLQRMAFPTGPLPARPPGVGFALHPPLTLAEVQSGRQRVNDARRATYFQLRRRRDRWEVFLDCGRPGRFPRATDLTELRDAAETRGREAVTLFFGGAPPSVVLTVPETGDYRLFRGSGAATLEVHRRSYADYWYCRVVVPDHWLRTDARYTLVGAMRTHGDDNALETGPFASLPWRLPSRPAPWPVRPPAR